MATKRTDIHRVGAIIPAHYGYVISYSLAAVMDGYPVPSIGVNCEIDRRTYTLNPDGTSTTIQGKHNEDGRCCCVALRTTGKPFADHGGIGKCTVCGANYIYGDVWQHMPTGVYIHVGHDCCDKYNMVADRTDYTSKNEAIRSGIAKLILKELAAEARAAFFTANPGLEAALKVNHPIIKDIGEKLNTYKTLTPRQIAFVFKLADEVLNPKPAEKHVPAPTGKATFTGTVVSEKGEQGFYGFQTKITVKVQTPTGSWMAYGTAPAALLASKPNQSLKGVNVTLTATLEPGRDAHFAFMKRPSVSNQTSLV